MSEDIEKKIAEAEEFLPGVAKKLERYENTEWGQYTGHWVRDTAQAVVGEYHVVAARRHQHHYLLDGGGIEWTDWIDVHYAKPGEPIRTVHTKQIVTRDQYDPKKDLTQLWGYNQVGLNVVDDEDITVFWLNREDDSACPEMIQLGKKVLLADDDEQYRAALARALYPTEVEEASSGRDLAYKATEGYRRYAVIITDNNMETGEDDGIEAITRIREVDGKTPIVFMSAGLDDAVRQAATEAGATHILAKPVSLEELKALLRSYL